MRIRILTIAAASVLALGAAACTQAEQQQAVAELSRLPGAVTVVLERLDPA